MQRIGFGYDIHRLDAGGPLVMGGVQIEHDQHLAGHSDGDAVLHAVTDAVLGAIAAGDIGQHFPDSDAKWRGADSARFVAHAVKLATESGYSVGNCDITVIAERPKLGPHRQAMQERIAELLGVEHSAVSVKAKTNEGLGPVGRQEAIAAMAVVILVAARST